MNETFPLDYGKVGDPDDDIQLRDASTKHAWGTLVMDGKYWVLKVGQRSLNSCKSSRDGAFLFACGVRLGGRQNG